MIENWINLSKLYGSGNDNISVNVDDYNGRDTRWSEIAGSADIGNASDSIIISQSGVNIITIDSCPDWIEPTGSFTISGTTNGEYIWFDLPDFIDIDSATVNGDSWPSYWMAYGSRNETNIGSDEIASWELRCKINSNTSDSANYGTITVNIGQNSGGAVASASHVINQQAGYKSYSIVSATLTYEDANASGSSLTPTLSVSQSWGWNGDTSNGGTIYTYSSVEYNIDDVRSSGYKTYPTIDSQTGEINIYSIDNIEKLSKFDVCDVRAKVIADNGGIGWAYCTIKQKANTKTTTTSISIDNFTYDTIIPASGGSSSPNLSYNIDSTNTYTSGYSDTIQTSSGASVSYTVSYMANTSSLNTSTGVVSADSLGTNYSSFDKNLMTVIVSVVYEGITRNKTSSYVTQAANTRTTVSSISINEFSYSTYIPASGGSVTPAFSYVITNTDTYASGAIGDSTTRTTGASVSYSKISGSGTVNNAGRVTCGSKGTTISNATDCCKVMVTATYNDSSDSAEWTVKQDHNWISAVQSNNLYDIQLRYETKASAGGSVISPTFKAPSRYNWKYDSGSTSTTKPSSTYGTLTETPMYSWSGMKDTFRTISPTSGTISVISKGSEISGETYSNDVTVTLNVKWTPSTAYSSANESEFTISKTLTSGTTYTPTQEANKLTTIAINNLNLTYMNSDGTENSESNPGNRNGDTFTPYVSMITRYRFTSGYSTTITPSYGSVTVSDYYSDSGYDAPFTNIDSNGKVYASANTSQTIAECGLIFLTRTITYNDSISGTVSTQDTTSGAIVYLDAAEQQITTTYNLTFSDQSNSIQQYIIPATGGTISESIISNTSWTLNKQ